MKGSGLLRHGFTPLRYPGGKAKLAAYVKRILRLNGLSGGIYVEPYAGGAGLALELLLHEYVEHVYLNDVSRPIWAFWNAVLNDTEGLLRLIRNTTISVKQWDKQKQRIRDAVNTPDLELGFAAFFLNRTNRSGILNGGIIGGRAQHGAWKIDARYNPGELSLRVEAIANMRDSISLSRQDAYTFLQRGRLRWPKKTLIYLDPPYFVKGRCLYLDAYTARDHAQIATLMQDPSWVQSWIVSYDDVPEINELYSKSTRITYGLSYSAREARQGREVMFFSSDLSVPPAPEVIQKGTVRHVD